MLAGGYLPKKFNKYHRYVTQPSSSGDATDTLRLHRLSGYILVVLLSVTLLLGGLFSKFVVNHAWTATRFIVYGLGPVSIAGGVLSRARYFFPILSFHYKTLD